MAATTPTSALSAENQATLTIAIMAAFADGSNSAVERRQMDDLVGRLDNPNFGDAYQRVMSGQIDLVSIASQLTTPDTRRLAYEAAAGICGSDGAINPQEQAFLDRLRTTLGLDPVVAQAVTQAADHLVDTNLIGTIPPPLPTAGASPLAASPNGAAQTTPPTDAEIQSTIQNHAILAAGLELLPGGLSTAAILPVQMKMVYGIGKRYGYSLDTGHIKDFLATLGIGVTGQVLESFARRLIGGAARQLAGNFIGGLVGGAVNMATGPALTFGTTYALGQVAKSYYSSGRKMSIDQLKSVFSQQSAAAQGLYQSVAPQVQIQASSLSAGGLARLLPSLRS
ncbi:MAG: DUF533 domain-containing protein [Phycisphaerales bacterium]